MNSTEIIILLLLLFMTVPDLCRRVGRPPLGYPAFVLFGLLLGPILNPEVSAMLRGAGQVGFQLLLFEVGLEIDLPRWRDLLLPFRFAGLWALVQYPTVLLLAGATGLSLVESLIAATTLTGCSVGMAHVAWKHHPGLETRTFVLRVMIALETLSILALAVGVPALTDGLHWELLARFVGIAVVVFLVARFAPHLEQLFSRVLQSATHWRTHLLVLLVLAICAGGNRLGLSAAKTAFFLGLFMSRTEHEGKGLEAVMAPVSQRFLIPMFFVSLGMSVKWALVFSWVGLMAFGAAGLLLGVRQVLHRHGLSVGGDRRAFLLLCPNLTVVALGASVLLESRNASMAAGWLLLTGVFLTTFAILLLPAASSGNEAAGVESTRASAFADNRLQPAASADTTEGPPA